MSEPSRIVPPNYTQIPNVVLDSMSEMSDSEFRVVLAVARQTFGWHRERDKISVSQLQKLTGLSRQGVVNGIKAGERRGLIERIPDEADKRGGFWYRLLVNDVDQSIPLTSQQVDQSTELTRTSQRTRPELVNDVDQSEGDLRQQEAVNGMPKERERNTKETMRESDRHDRPDTSLSLKNGTSEPKQIDPLALAIAEACCINPKAPTKKQRDALNAAYVALKAMGATPEDIPLRVAWWEREDWRAREEPGRPITPEELWDVWEKAKKPPRTTAKANAPPTDNRPPLPPFQPQSRAPTNGARLRELAEEEFKKRHGNTS